MTSAAKAILSKKVLDGKPLGENLTPANMFAVLTILGFLFILPASLLLEGPGAFGAAWCVSVHALACVPQDMAIEALLIGCCVRVCARVRASACL